MHNSEQKGLEIIRRSPDAVYPCRFGQDEYAELKAFAEANGASIGDVIRSALAQCRVITVRAAE